MATKTNSSSGHGGSGPQRAINGRCENRQDSADCTLPQLAYKRAMSKDDDTGAPGSNRDTHYAKLRRAHRDAKRDSQGLPPAQPRRKRDLPPRKGALYAGRVAPDTL